MTKYELQMKIIELIEQSADTLTEQEIEEVVDGVQDWYWSLH